MSTNDGYFDDLLKSKKKKKGTVTLLDNLFKVPKKDKGDDMPTFQRYDPNIYHQADILYLPHDTEFKYCLVVSDVGTRKVEAEPLKEKSANAVVKALKIIYKKRNILDYPESITFDQGTEFKGETKAFLDGLGIQVKYAKRDRHRQVAVVERANQTIGTLIHKRQTEEELLTGETSRSWVSDLPAIIRAINRKVDKTPIKKQSDDPVGSADSWTHMFSVGDHVRVALDAPEDVLTGKRLHGKFRSSDVRWSRQIHTIKAVLVGPRSPPMYLLERFTNPTDAQPFDSASYTKNQLQFVGIEQLPKQNAIRPVDNKYIVDKILDKKTEGGKTFYFIHWKGFNDSANSWEPSATLKKDVPELIQQYENSLRVPKAKEVVKKPEAYVAPIVADIRRSTRERKSPDKLRF